MKTVLIADDQPAIRSLVNAVLADHYQVLEAATGEEVLAMLKQARPDLALIDVSMPGLNGVEVARRLQNDPATAALPIILLSGLGEPEAGDVAVAGYLGKPFTPATLLQAVERLIGR